MRPTPEEIVFGLRKLLRDEIAPALATNREAGVHLRRVMAVLRDGRWDEAAFDLLRENAAFGALAADCRSRLTAIEPLPAALGALEGLIAGIEAERSPDSFAQANAINRRLRDVLARFVEAMRDGELPDDADLADRIVTVTLQSQQRTLGPKEPR